MTFRSMCRGAACVAALLFAAGRAPAAPVFDLTGGTALVGQPLFVTAHARDLTDLYGYQFSLVFDPTHVQYAGVTEGGFLSSAGTTFFDGGTLNAAGNRLDFVFDTLVGPGGGATGSGDLATFRFTALQGGLAAFSFADVLAIDSRLATIDVGTAAVALAIPEPPLAALLVIGLFGATAAASKRHRRPEETSRSLARTRA